MPDQGKPDICARTFAFAVRIVQLCGALGRHGDVGRKLGNQLLRAGTSIGANVEEAQAAVSRREFHCKITIALKEARETCYWLRLLVAAEVMPTNTLRPLQAESNEIKLILGKIAASTRPDSDEPDPPHE